MTLLFQLLDCDYIFNGAKPIIRLFGKTETGSTVSVLFDSFMPYFYTDIDEKNKERQKEKIGEMKQIIKVEEVEKFIPLGYHEKPTKLLKVTLKNPQDVPSVKEALLQERLVNKVYEADILFKYRFLVDNSIYGMNWIDVDAEKTFTKTVKSVAYHGKKIKQVKKEENAPLRILSFDRMPAI